MGWTAKQRALAYEQIQAIHVGFEGVRLAIEEVKVVPGLDRSELAAFRELAEEARATLLSYLAEAIETAETDAAGSLYRRRNGRDRKRESFSR